MGVLVALLNFSNRLAHKNTPRKHKYKPTLEHIYAFKHLLLYQKDVKKLRKCFERIDDDDEEVITPEAFKRNLKLDETIFSDQSFRLFDESDAGTIDFRAFVVGVYNCCTMSRRAFETMAFDLYDTDNDGIIDVEELVDVIETNMYRESGVRLRDNIVSKVRAAAIRHRGAINYTAFWEISRQFPTLLLPAYRIHAEIRKRIVGERFWKKMTARRPTPRLERLMELEWGRNWRKLWEAEEDQRDRLAMAALQAEERAQLARQTLKGMNRALVIKKMKQILARENFERAAAWVRAEIQSGRAEKKAGRILHTTMAHAKRSSEMLLEKMGLFKDYSADPGAVGAYYGGPMVTGGREAREEAEKQQMEAAPERTRFVSSLARRKRMLEEDNAERRQAELAEQAAKAEEKKRELEAVQREAEEKVKREEEADQAAMEEARLEEEKQAAGAGGGAKEGGGGLKKRMAAGFGTMMKRAKNKGRASGPDAGEGDKDPADGDKGKSKRRNSKVEGVGQNGTVVEVKGGGSGRRKSKPEQQPSGKPGGEGRRSRRKSSKMGANGEDPAGSKTAGDSSVASTSKKPSPKDPKTSATSSFSIPTLKRKRSGGGRSKPSKVAASNDDG